MYHNKINRDALIRVYQNEWVLIDKEDIYSSITQLNTDLTNENTKLNKLLVENKTEVKNQFKTGDIKLTYTRLNGKVETFMIDKNENLSKNFKVYEFLSPDSNELILSELLVSIIQNIRDKYKKAVVITSGYRTQAFNDSLKGSIKNSEHIKGKALDFQVSGINKNDVLKYAKTIPNVVYAYTNETNMKKAVHINI